MNPIDNWKTHDCLVKQHSEQVLKAFRKAFLPLRTVFVVNVNLLFFVQYLDWWISWHLVVGAVSSQLGDFYVLEVCILE